MFIYRFEDKEGKVLYVGKTINKLNDRIKGHLSTKGFLPLEFFRNCKIHIILNVIMNMN